MPGLIDSTGLAFGSGLSWLIGGLGTPDLVNPPSTIITLNNGVEITTNQVIAITTG